METPMPESLETPLEVEDRELFQRVWQRVMPDQEQSPIAVLPPQPQVHQHDLPQLGQASMAYAQPIREMMESLQEHRQLYQSLARRTQGQNARSLSALAARHQGDLRRLGAVYFLLTGERFYPAVSPALPAGPLGGALREMFAREQRLGQRFSQAGEHNPDSCLEGLFSQLARQSQTNLEEIRAILERM